MYKFLPLLANKEMMLGTAVLGHHCYRSQGPRTAVCPLSWVSLLPLGSWAVCSVVLLSPWLPPKLSSALCLETTDPRETHQPSRSSKRALLYPESSL